MPPGGSGCIIGAGSDYYSFTTSGLSDPGGR